MARRADHTREELTELILDAGIEIIENEGFSNFSARKVASRIGYTVGTIYNVFGNHEMLILHINARTLDQWFDELEQSVKGKQGVAALKAMARNYIAFSARHYNLWTVLFDHRSNADQDMPDWYKPKLSRFFALVEDILGPMLGHQQNTIHQTARILWAGIHGICVLSLSHKLELTETDSAEILAMSLIDQYIKGL